MTTELAAMTSAKLRRRLAHLASLDPDVTAALRSHAVVAAGSAVAVVALLSWRLHDVAALPAFLYLGLLGVVLALTDLHSHRLPNRLVLPSYGVVAVLLGVAAIATSDWHSLVSGLIGMSAWFGGYLVLAFINPRGLGMGDVKLAGLLGLALGWIGLNAVFSAAVGAFVLTAVTGLVLIACRRASLRAHIAMGPSMLIATGICAFLYG